MGSTKHSIMKLKSLNDFDTPVNYSRIGYNGGELGYYPNNYDLTECDNGVFKLSAIPSGNHFNASRLVTKNTLTLKPPFAVEVTSMWTKSSGAFYCPLWIFPTDPKIVCEIDGIEWHGGNPDSLYFTFHNSGFRWFIKPNGDSPYSFSFHSRQTIKPMTTDWNTIKVKVCDYGIVWYLNGKRVKTIFCLLKDIEFYLRSTVQVATWAYNGDLPDITDNDPAVMYLKDYKVII